MPKDRVTQSHQGYGFVEFLAEDDADYAIKIMNMIKLYGKPIRVNKVKIINLVFRFNRLLLNLSLNIIPFSMFTYLCIFFGVLGLSTSKELGCGC